MKNRAQKLNESYCNFALVAILKFGTTPKSQILMRSTKGTFQQGLFPFSPVISEKMIMKDDNDGIK